jgi:hypothetical protein
MTDTAEGRSSVFTGVRIAALVALWLAVALFVAPALGLYYEVLAAWVTLPALGLILAYDPFIWTAPDRCCRSASPSGARLDP